MQSAVGLGDGLVEDSALNGGELKLLRGGLAAAVGTGEGTGTPGAATMDLAKVGDLREGLGVTERNVENSMVSEGRHGGNGGRLLTTTEGTGGDEETGVLAVETTAGPESTGLVPEGLL